MFVLKFNIRSSEFSKKKIYLKLVSWFFFFFFNSDANVASIIIIFSCHLSFKYANNAHRLPHKHIPLVINGNDQIDYKLKITEIKLTVTKM